MRKSSNATAVNVAANNQGPAGTIKA
jgi:hypothetical protein